MQQFPPDNPAGPFQPVHSFDDAVRVKLTTDLSAVPSRLRDAVADLDDSQLDTKYKNWTIRQITHHVADSHMHSVIRFKWALTEEQPLIKAYEEGDWVALEDSKHGSVEPSLALLDGLHLKWGQLLESMTAEQFGRTFLHPQSGDSVSLWEALNYYPWHGRHHTGQIAWIRENRGW